MLAGSAAGLKRFCRTHNQNIAPWSVKSTDIIITIINIIIQQEYIIIIIIQQKYIIIIIIQQKYIIIIIIQQKYIIIIIIQQKYIIGKAGFHVGVHMIST